MEKLSFLLSSATSVSISDKETWMYDDTLHMNMTNDGNGEKLPACMISSMFTHSKTESLPGDDDPDPDAEMCY